jgi:two-component system, NtrC family, response regulator HydG
VLIDIGLFRTIGESFLSGRESWPALPPELLEGEKATARTDVFLAGRLLHYRLTGRKEGKVGLPREVPGWGPRLTLDLERIAAKATQPSPDRRFGSVAEFRAALEKALGEPPRRAGGVELLREIVGRDRELDASEDILRDADSGAARVLWLAAGEGMGKTRILAEVKLRAQLRGLPTIEVRFLPDPGPGPALIESLRAAKGRRGSAAWLEPLDPRFGGTPRERAARAAAAYFRDEGKPLVLLLDDADLADRGSLDLIEALVLECRGRKDPGKKGLALCIASSRPPSRKLAPRGAASVRPAAITILTLKALDASGSRALFQALLHPLPAPAPVVHRALRAARGSPRALREIARALRSDWLEAGIIPEAAKIPALPPAGAAARILEPSGLSVEDRSILEVLAVAGREATGEEIARGARLPVEDAVRRLRSLAKQEVVAGRGSGRMRRFQLVRPEDARAIARGVPRTRSVEIHRRLLRFLEGSAPPGGRSDGRREEDVARHVLALGRTKRGIRLALEASRLLDRSGLHERAAALLREVLAAEEEPGRRLEIAEELCGVLDQIGDHQAAIEVIEPFYKEERLALTATRKVRVRRLLGYNCHRAGLPDRALEVFREAQALAVPGRDREDLVFIDSELAEIHIFLGRHGEAEEDCRRGLRRIAEMPARGTSCRRIEVLLRASLGHIEMRRLKLPRARKELVRAAELSRGRGFLGDRAAILHNLAIVRSELNELAEARRTFREAERLFLRSGKEREVIKTCTNVALIEAKLGRRDEARAALGRAAEMLRHYPGQRLECFAAYSRGLVAHLFGEVEPAAEGLEEAASLARKLGDVSLEGFARVYLAEVHLLSGRCGKALDLLREVLDRLGTGAPPVVERAPVLERMARSRLALTEALLGREAARETLDGLARLPRTDVLYLEAWNDLVLGLASILCGRPMPRAVAEALEAFEGWGVHVGARMARLILLANALSRKDLAEVQAAMAGRPPGESASRFFRVAEPLALAEASFDLGDPERAEVLLAAASSAIVGLPFLELDLRIELLRARLAARGGVPGEARRHLHRCLHTRDLLIQLVPPEDRARFPGQTRFAGLREAGKRLAPAASIRISTEGLERSGPFEGMVGRSKGMLQLFRAIQQLRDKELPVLVTGETGTGKDLAARAIHRRSVRREGPLQVISCACLPSELFESEVFGHAAGAFTGADRDEPGILEAASGGTVLLDEVSALPLDAQAKLLKVIDSGTARRLGSPFPRRIDVRFLATSSEDLRAAAERGAFRADLFYRLAAVELRLPPLRERREDIAPLAAHFLEQHAARLDRAAPSLEHEVLERLERLPWPGNVRELEMLLLGLLVRLPESNRIGLQDLEQTAGARPPAPLREDLLSRGLADLRKDLERDYLTQLFRKVGGDTRAMMRELGVKSTKLYAWLRDLGLEIRDLRRKLGK